MPFDRPDTLRQLGASWTGAALAGVLLISLACGKEDVNPWQVRRPAGVSPTSFELRFVLEQEEPGAVELPGPDGKPLRLAAKPLAVRTDVAKVEVERDLIQVYEERQQDAASVMPRTPPHYVVLVTLTPDAAQGLSQATQAKYGRRLAIVVDGRILMAPVLNASLPADRAMMIQGSFTREAAIRLAERLAP
jgi:preprotein translocase subunit SecD